MQQSLANAKRANMPTKTFDIHQMQAHLVELISLMSSGTEVILTDGSKPLARLLPLTSETKLRVAGLRAGAIQTSDDFDRPLSDEFWVSDR